jgi:cell division protein FtsB
MIRFKYIDRVPSFLRNRYILTLVIFAVWLLFLDSNNLFTRFRDLRDLRKLRSEKEYYIHRIEEDKRKLLELKTDNKNLEKFAREQYRMKKADEDLYIVLSPQENRRMNREID